MIDSLPFRVPKASPMGRLLKNDVIGYSQNIVAVTVEFSNFVCRS